MNNAYNTLVEGEAADRRAFSFDWDGESYRLEMEVEESPGDPRKAKAADLWMRLSRQAAWDLELDDDLIEAYNCLAATDLADLAEAQRRVYSEVGFHFFPACPDELLRAVLDRAISAARTETSS